MKPRSAAHFPTSTTSAGLQHLSICAHVHLVWFRAASRHMWPSPWTNIFHVSQLLASLGGHQLEPCSPDASISLPRLRPKSSSAAVETREGSNAFSYQQVYLWFEMPVYSWHGTFTVYNHKVRTFWDKPSIESLCSTKNELEPSRCAVTCYLIS